METKLNNNKNEENIKNQNIIEVTIYYIYYSYNKKSHNQRSKIIKIYCKSKNQNPKISQHLNNKLMYVYYYNILGTTRN